MRQNKIILHWLLLVMIFYTIRYFDFILTIYELVKLRLKDINNWLWQLLLFRKSIEVVKEEISSAELIDQLRESLSIRYWILSLSLSPSLARSQFSLIFRYYFNNWTTICYSFYQKIEIIFQYYFWQLIHIWNILFLSSSYHFALLYFILIRFTQYNIILFYLTKLFFSSGKVAKMVIEKIALNAILTEFQESDKYDILCACSFIHLFI